MAYAVSKLIEKVKNMKSHSFKISFECNRKKLSLKVYHHYKNMILHRCVHTHTLNNLSIAHRANRDNVSTEISRVIIKRTSQITTKSVCTIFYAPLLLNAHFYFDSTERAVGLFDRRP